jgi:WXG100 family type VII secretion target
VSLIKVTSEELHGLSGRVQSGSGQIQDQLVRMQGDVTSVLGSDWQGTASGQFQNLWEEWQRSAAGLRDALDGIAQLLGSAATQYQLTEDGIKATMAG